MGDVSSQRHKEGKVYKKYTKYKSFFLEKEYLRGSKWLLTQVGPKKLKKNKTILVRSRREVVLLDWLARDVLAGRYPPPCVFILVHQQASHSQVALSSVFTLF